MEEKQCTASYTCLHSGNKTHVSVIHNYKQLPKEHGVLYSIGNLTMIQVIL